MTTNTTAYLGVDWGSETHQWCVLDATGGVLGERAVPHRTTDIQAALEWVQHLTGSPPAQIGVAIETPRGVLVDTLLEQGYAVAAINPKQLDRFRDRFCPAGAKDDRRDARALADALRTDPRAFRAVRPEDPAIIRLREVSRVLDDLQVEEGRLRNRLREQLGRVQAGWLTLCPAADEPWLWDLLRATPHPDHWGTLARRRITPVLRAQRIRRITADEVMAALHAARLTVAPGVTDAVAVRIELLVPQLLLIRQQLRTTQHQLDRLLTDLAAAGADDPESREHRDVEILRSLPGVGRIVAATMLSEAVGPLADRDYGTLRAYTGSAPITRRSGKRLPTVHMRYACKGRLRNAMFHWARTSIQSDVPARAYYERLRARGHSFGRALRSVADRWLRILVAMLKSGTLYDSARFATGA